MGNSRGQIQKSRESKHNEAMRMFTAAGDGVATALAESAGLFAHGTNDFIRFAGLSGEDMHRSANQNINEFENRHLKMFLPEDVRNMINTASAMYPKVKQGAGMATDFLGVSSAARGTAKMANRLGGRTLSRIDTGYGAPTLREVRTGNGQIRSKSNTPYSMTNNVHTKNSVGYGLGAAYGIGTELAEEGAGNYEGITPYYENDEYLSRKKVMQPIHTGSMK